jgi:large subunit ribosomal protein L9
MFPFFKNFIISFFTGVGMKDDIVSVRPEFGRNNLILPGLAIYASPDNLELRNKRLAAKTETEAEKHSSRYSGMVHIPLI